MNLGEVGWGGVDWIGLAQDRHKWRALVNAIMNLQETIKWLHKWWPPRVASSSIELVSYILCCQLDILGFNATTYILVKKLNFRIIKMLKFIEI
jgi:hypothetical protein